MLSAVGLCGVIAGPVAIAQASNRSILSSFNAGNGRINQDEKAVASGLIAYNDKHVAGPAIHALRHEVSDLHAFSRALGAQPASNAAGRKAKAEITRGLRLIAKAYGALATDVRRSSQSYPVPKATVEKTLRTGRKGRKSLISGLRLLGRHI